MTRLRGTKKGDLSWVMNLLLGRQLSSYFSRRKHDKTPKQQLGTEQIFISFNFERIPISLKCKKLNKRCIYIYIFIYLLWYITLQKNLENSPWSCSKKAAVREKNPPLHSSAAAWLAEEVGRRTAKNNNLKMMGWNGQMKFLFLGGGPNV